MKLLLIYNKKDDDKYSNSSFWKKETKELLQLVQGVFIGRRVTNVANVLFSKQMCNQFICFADEETYLHNCTHHNMHWLHILQYDRCRVSSCQCPYFTSGAKSSLEISNSNPFLSNWAPGATKRLQVEQWYINLHINWTGIADICSCSSNHSQGQTLIEILSF